MAEPDHGDREVTVTSSGVARRRVRRPAGPPQDAGAEKSAPESPSKTQTGPNKPKTTGKPIKSSPMGRKRKPGVTPLASPAAATEAGATTEAVDLVKSPVAEQEDADQSPVIARRVSYRERRSSQHRNSAGDPANPNATSSARPKKKRANLRGLAIVLAAVTALGLIAAMVAASTLFVLGSNKIDDRNALRGEYSAFARQMVTNLTTLNPENIDASIKSFQDDTSGKAMEQIGQSVEQTVNMIKSENVSTKGAVISDAVTASDANTATVIMVFSWEMNQPNVTDRQTVLQTFRWKLQITRINGELKLTNVEWVT